MIFIIFLIPFLYIFKIILQFLYLIKFILKVYIFMKNIIAFLVLNFLNWYFLFTFIFFDNFWLIYSGHIIFSI